MILENSSALYMNPNAFELQTRQKLIKKKFVRVVTVPSRNTRLLKGKSTNIIKRCGKRKVHKRKNYIVHYLHPT